MTILYYLAVSILLCSLTSAHSQRHKARKLIDLGYAKHIPTYTNKTIANATLLNYNNIRYALPPTGSNRFRKPRTPPAYQPGIQTGNRSSWETDCLSSAPVGVPFPLLNGSTWGSEDCLFLNVVMPEGVKEGDKVPVLHWVVGSAYAFGGKDWTGFGINVLGLFNRPLNLSDRFIIVTHNYRLGIPGWLPKFEDDMNGNLGVWDSLAAIEWTKKYICKFGGDPDNITVIGQSAGAGIITWLLLGNEGRLKLPFDQAWISSPAIAPRKSLERSRPVFDFILNSTNCTDVACLRRLPESAMRDANKLIFDQIPSPGGGSLGLNPGLTPTVDGELLSDLPVTAFTKGNFNKGLKQLFIGNTAFEGLGLSSDRDMPSRFPELVRGNIPSASNESIARLQSMYNYPPELPEKLAWDYTTDIVFGCTASNIAAAYSDRARRFLFSVPPATHGLDISYFFFADNTTTPVVDLGVALASESYLLQCMFRKDFSVNPNAPYARPLSEWPYAQSNETTANIAAGGYVFRPMGTDVRMRCAYINEILTDQRNGV
ncbi:putative lipase 1 [Lentithecium fluviatile CBS 122367]|uniref:Carboxylic ester hydrolase n=1 Tax=Lentithecium fluviatile CBS 122367 TaxID=1168545 RepID=A0A6G1J3B6_9PLEO|nr:putative lipase 1 [Lentithecium fluviatile CBS 122367]